MSYITNGLKAKELLVADKDYIVRGASSPSSRHCLDKMKVFGDKTYVCTARTNRLHASASSSIHFLVIPPPSPPPTPYAGDDIAIVDRFSGRVLEGRKYSDGLQQSIQTKEGLPCSSQSQVIATITYQSLFRLFYKLSGMTGTALTDFKVRAD